MALPGVAVTLRYVPEVVGYNGGAVAQNNLTYLTDGAGLLTMPGLVGGEYRMSIAMPVGTSAAVTEAMTARGVANGEATQTLEDFLQTTIGEVTPSILSLAIAAAERAEEAADRAEIYVGPNPFYFLHAGQSNATGYSGVSSPLWPGPEFAGLAYVWVPSLNAWRDVTTRKGLDPFNPDGSQNSGVWTAIDLAIRRGITVRMITSYSPGTEISAWTGGGYLDGNPITTDRTISATNRVLCYELEAEIAAAAIPHIHAIGWQQGEADSLTPDAVYMAELDFLRGYFAGLGSNPVATARVPFVVSGLYSGGGVYVSDRRNICISDYTRQNSDVCGYVAVDDLQADAIGNPGGVYRHFDNAGLVAIGHRMAAAIEAVWYGRSGHYDAALDTLRVAGDGAFPSRIGYRSYEFKLTDQAKTLEIRGAVPAMRGETYRIIGACTLNLDPVANGNQRDGGAGFEFYLATTSDSVTLTSDDGAGETRNIWLVGDPVPVSGTSGLTITGVVGRGRVVFEFNRWVVRFDSHKARVAPAIQSITVDGGIAVAISAGAFVDLAATLTAHRVLNLLPVSAQTGDIMSIRRTGGGSYNWTVRDATVTTSSIVLSAAGQWADMLFDGAKWVPWRS